jgi:PKD repeat protein/N-acetyl-anhydromuramyl-L-alanine amidase AmpD
MPITRYFFNFVFHFKRTNFFPMKYKVTLLFLFVFSIFSLHSFCQEEKNYETIKIDQQVNAALEENYLSCKAYFDNAYILYPEVPKGLLEAVSYHYTHFRHIDNSFSESSEGLPRVYGIMGLTLDGKNYFRNNLITVAGLSGYSAQEIIEDPAINIKAFAAAFSAIKNQLNITSGKPEDMLKILVALSELNISSETAINDYTMNLYLFGILSFLNNEDYQKQFNFPEYKIDLEKVFGAANLKVYSSTRVGISNGGVTGNLGQIYAPTNITTACPDYNFSNCSWVATTNHYTGWNGHTVSAIAIHTVQGSYTSCINWFVNTSSSASTHYVVASNSSYAGQVTQMVDESNAAWHVTSENYYAIGYEHEGFVEDASWYTTTMYQTSANLTRDVCTGNNIDPMRMFYRDTLDDGTVLDYGVHSLGAEGSCIKIKGHQHFPGQSHVDPGPNWYWDYYFRLVNQGTTSTTSYTANSGSFYDTGGASGNYSDDERKFWLIHPTGATSVTLTFASFALETNYDFMYIYNGTSEFAPLIGRYNTISPGTVTATSGSMFIEFRSDCATPAAGWAATWTSVQPDVVVPTTITSVSGNWQTQNFTANFTDTDNSGGSGIEKSFYQVLDYNGYEWHANAQNGFFADNFDSYNSSVWSVPASSGTWSATGGNLVQTDSSINNTNIYASLNQSLSNRYIYQFNIKLDAATSGTNKHRFGFHFFCDNGSLTNRGNSYFIFFRIEDQTLEFYKVVSDAFTLSKTVNNVTTAFGQSYDIKIIFDRITGKIDVYRDDILLGSWTDTSPLTTTGSYISFRTGHCKASINELKVFRSRNPSVAVSVGSAATNDIRYQNPSPTTSAAKIKSIVNDIAGNLSSINYYDLNIDWTPPTCVTVNDGAGSDIDTTTSANTLYANWATSSDPNSGIAKYYYAIGTTAGGTDVVSWTDNGLNTSVTKSGITLTNGQHYYISIKTENGAGLTSICNSDGILVNIAVSGFTILPSTICAGQSIQFTNTSINATSYQWTFTGGTPATSTQTNPLITYTNGGNFNVQLIATGPGGSNTSTQQVTVNSLPTANAGSDVAICYGNSALLSASGGSIYAWGPSTGLSATNISNPSASPTSTTTYIVTVTSTLGCQKTDNILVTVNPLPTANAGSDVAICYGNSALLSASGGSIYAWGPSTGLSATNISNPSAAPTATTNYIVTVTSTLGCQKTDNILVTVNPLPTANSGSDVAICYGNSTPLSASGGSIYAWGPSTGLSATNISNPIAAPTATTNYIVTVTSTLGCQKTDNILVTVNPLPVAGFSSIDTLISLPGAQAQFTNNSTYATNYLWVFGDGNTSTDLNPLNTYTTAGDYTVTLIAYSSLCGNDTLTIPQYIHVDISTGIGENSNGFDLSIQPNPFKDNTTLYFNVSKEQQIKITITDMLGREILISDKIYSAGKQSININSGELKLSKGIYTLNLFSDKATSNARLIKY